MDVAPSGVDKGSTLEFLLEELGLKHEELIAVGDSHNDLSADTGGWIGVAMANATEAVKRAADYVTTSNNADGIAHLLNKYILQILRRKNVADLDVDLSIR